MASPGSESALCQLYRHTFPISNYRVGTTHHVGNGLASNSLQRSSVKAQIWRLRQTVIVYSRLLRGME